VVVNFLLEAAPSKASNINIAFEGAATYRGRYVSRFSPLFIRFAIFQRARNTKRRTIEEALWPANHPVEGGLTDALSALELSLTWLNKQV
jgi:hypothetical protein